MVSEGAAAWEEVSEAAWEADWEGVSEAVADSEAVVVSEAAADSEEAGDVDFILQLSIPN